MNLRGIISPIPTPLAKNGDLDRTRIKLLVDFLVEGGIDGIFPLGTTGEFPLLSREERMKVVELTVDSANGRIPVICGVSDPSIENVRAFIKHAMDVGADGVVATPPYYFKPKDDEIYLYYSKLSGYSDLPLVVYNIPEYTGTIISAEIIQKLAEKRIISGMKYSGYNMLYLLKYINAVKGKISILTGSDAMAYTCLEFGGSGAVIAVANVAPRKVSSIYDLYVKGKKEEAKNMQVELLPAIEAISVGNFPAGLKGAMRLIGMPVGGTKEPFSSLSKQEKNLVRELLSKAGLVKPDEAK